MDDRLWFVVVVVIATLIVLAVVGPNQTDRKNIIEDHYFLTADQFAQRYPRPTK